LIIYGPAYWCEYNLKYELKIYPQPEKATARIQMSNFEWLLTNLKDRFFKIIHDTIIFKILKQIFWIPAVAYSGDSSENMDNFANTIKNSKSF
jgi:hypothetical protein